MDKITMNYGCLYPNGTTREIKEEVDKANFYKRIAKLLMEEFKFGFMETVLVTVTVIGDDGVLNYSVRRRKDKEDQDGKKVDNHDTDYFVSEDGNTLTGSYPCEVIEKYLTCVNEGNAYKDYTMKLITGKDAIDAWDRIPSEKKELLKECGLSRGDALLKVSYGRMGEAANSLWKHQTRFYHPNMFWPKFMEKMRHGYTDNSEAYLSAPITVEQNGRKTTAVKRVEGASATLFDQLRAYATNSVKKAQIRVPVTVKIIEMSKANLQKMRESTSVAEFNTNLKNLMALLQRPVPTGNGSGVAKMLASDSDDFARIIQREDDLIQSMEGSIDGTVPILTGDFTDYGIEVYLAKDYQKAQVLSKLSDQLKSRVKTIYRVIPKKQGERFNQYLASHNNPKRMQLWHGSRNENWMSIIQNSLLLNPNAAITGKMFGQGIYFAPSSLKSWNYTSINGSYWANGNSDTAFMGLYAVAYGKAFDVDSYNSGMDYKKETLSRGCDCLHAHKGIMLKNDEIVFYDEAAMVLNYIVEFK